MEELEIKVMYSLFLFTGEELIGVCRIPKYYTVATGFDLINDKLNQIKTSQKAYKICLDDDDIELLYDLKQSMLN